jgi:hypothetical protein
MVKIIVYVILHVSCTKRKKRIANNGYSDFRLWECSFFNSQANDDGGDS